VASYPFSFDELLTGSVLIPSLSEKSGAEQTLPDYRAQEAGAEEAPRPDEEAAFFGALETNLTASLGQTAFLRCRLRNLEHQVNFLPVITSRIP